MELLLKKYFWVVHLLVVCVCAVLAAKAVNHVVEGRYLVQVKPPPAPPAPPPLSTSETPVRSKSPETLVTRNIFCHECQPEEPEVEDPQTGEVIDPNTAVATSLPLALVATNVSGGRGGDRFSSATVANTQTSFVGAFWLGETIPDAGVIEKIAPLYVEFRNDSNRRLERIALLADAPAAVGRPAAPTPPRPTTTGPMSSKAEFMNEVEGGVREVGPNKYEIDRSLVDKVLSNPTLIARSARIVPSIKDGKADGFKLYAIRPNSVYAQLGLKNGDTLHAVNGFEISSPDKALEVYAKLKSASHLTLQVGRRGKTETMSYQIK